MKREGTNNFQRDIAFNLGHIGLQGLAAIREELQITSMKLRGKMNLDRNM